MSFLLSVDELSRPRHTLPMGLSDKAHVEVAFILRRFLDNRTDYVAPDVARDWLNKHWPSIEEYRRAKSQGAKPVPVQLSQAMDQMLHDARGTELHVGANNPTARGLVRRKLAVWTRPGCLRLTEWGVEIEREQRQRGNAK